MKIEKTWLLPTWGCDTRVRAGLLLGTLLLINAAVWILAWAAFAGEPLLFGTALLAWVFGLRHAVDADHIVAIDNTVRKLMQDGGKPLLSGAFFCPGAFNDSGRVFNRDCVGSGTFSR